MSEFIAHMQLSNTPRTDLQEAIDQANQKSHLGRFLVCVTNAGEVLVLPEFSVTVRNDIAEIAFDTATGFQFSNTCH